MRSTYASIRLASIQHNISLIRSRLNPRDEIPRRGQGQRLRARYGRSPTARSRAARAYLGVAFAEEACACGWRASRPRFCCAARRTKTTWTT
jgi:hypothetical protein